jgi:hypothetical protein
MRLKSSNTIPLALAAIALGILGLFATLLYLAASYGHHINEGPRVTLPATDITLDLKPGIPYAIQQELTGSHVTVNQPLVELQSDTEIVLLDTLTTQPVEYTRTDWYRVIQFFGLRDKRRTIAEFTPPPSGQVTLSIPNAEPGQVVFVGPHHTVFASTTLPKVQIAALVSLIAVLLGVGLILAHLARRSHVSLDRPVTDEA